MRTIRQALIMAWAALALALAGCGGDSSVSSDEIDNEDPGINLNDDAWNFQPGTYPRFDPAGSDLPLNTDLIFAGSNDGTANVGVPENAAEDAVNDLDGFSTSAYFDVAFGGGQIDPATVCAALAPCGAVPPNVFVLKLTTSGDALPIGNITGVDSAVSVSAEVVSQDGGTDNVLRIFPEQTLDAKSKYLVFVTNTIQDKSGNAITPSFQYNLLSDPDPEISDQLKNVRNAIRQAWEPSANGFLTSQGIPGDIAISYSYTTTDPQAPLTAMGAPRAALKQEGLSTSQINNLESNGFLSTPKARPLDVSSNTGVDLNTLTQGQLAADTAKLYTGYIKLPYYQRSPSSQGEIAGVDKPFWGQEFWRPDQALADQLGKTIPEDADGTKNVTYRYPFTAQKSMESVPLQVILPVDTNNGGAHGCDGGSYTVALYIHGITSDRTSAISLAHTMATQCIATVAIDLPVHGVSAVNQFVDALNVDRGDLDGDSGPLPDYQTLYGSDAPHERHFEVVQDSDNNPVPMDFDNPDPAQDTSGAWFINLGTLQNTRDNMRQAVMDLLNLNASLGDISALNLDGQDGNDLNTSGVHVVGVSLGSIIGSVYAATNEKVIAAESNAGFTANVNPVQGAALSVGGSQVSQVLVNSNTFRPIINGGLKANGVQPGTSNYERFLYVAQSTVASGDPVNFTETLAGQGVPALYQMVRNDNVVPNTASITNAPLAGTEPFGKTLGGATKVDETSSPYDFTSGGMGPGFVVVDDPDNDGSTDDAATHSSLLTPSSGSSPDALSVTSEMQAQVTSFVASSGTQVAVGSEDTDAVEAP